MQMQHTAEKGGCVQHILSNNHLNWNAKREKKSISSAVSSTFLIEAVDANQLISPDLNSIKTLSWVRRILRQISKNDLIKSCSSGFQAQRGWTDWWCDWNSPICLSWWTVIFWDRRHSRCLKHRVAFPLALANISLSAAKRSQTIRLTDQPISWRCFTMDTVLIRWKWLSMRSRSDWRLKG